ncbi:complement C1q-like protein 3 [Crassostrea angulata]|uniref:complement C1q-like protein 3 n=1 Tax=Magallana angulata TaxID=2784310 RepID=UPI0022B1B68B|nr:complement C1q-like protein 3 [Crassostrea angulata]
MQWVANCTFLCLFLHLSVALGDCNNTMIASLIQNQMTLLEQVTNMVDNVSKFMCPSKKQIVFHAETGSSKTYQKGSLWVYDKVITNVGNAYNPSTGKFTAHTDGIYQFNWYTLSNPQVMSHAGLFVNGVIKARQASNNNGGTNQYITAGSSMALLLNEGDEVYIMDVHGYTANLGSQWTAFGGVLIN